MTERIITAMDDYGKQLSDVAAAHPEPEDDEHELAELRQRWASIAQVTREALFTARADGTLQWASEEAIRLMGLRRHDARGIRLSDLVDQADRARVTAGIQAAIGGRAAECRVRWRNVPGNPWVSLRFGPAVIGDTRTSVGGTITDIDAEVVAHEAFLHERRELEDLLHRTVEPHMR
ncbi:MAG: PAS domain S-box protein, partial [Actinobacteria bacterium]